MRVLLVTSFTRAMFAVTGSRMVRSFLASGTEGTLLVCHEGFPDRQELRHSRVRTYKLERSRLLREWLATHRDIIPEALGGAAGPCACPERLKPFGAHVPRCHGFWFNYSAARWFRKVVSLDYASRVMDYDCLLWLDADCTFTQPLTTQVVREAFQDKSVLYLKSPAREVLESGVLGVRNNPEGRAFLQAVVERYRSGAFRQDLRWDDGYQFQMTLQAHPEIPALDAASDATGAWPYGHVVPHSPFGPYLTHRKGTHAFALGLLTRSGEFADQQEPQPDESGSNMAASE